MSKCKYCDSSEAEKFTYFGEEFFVCKKCARCFICNKAVPSGEEQFFSVSYTRAGINKDLIKSMSNGNILFGKKEFGIVIHKKCARCMLCGKAMDVTQVSVIIVPKGRLLVLCKKCEEYLDGIL